MKQHALRRGILFHSGGACSGPSRPFPTLGYGTFFPFPCRPFDRSCEFLDDNRRMPAMKKNAYSRLQEFCHVFVQKAVCEESIADPKHAARQPEN
jgi:hypothetical protein